MLQVFVEIVHNLFFQHIVKLVNFKSKNFRKIILGIKLSSITDNK